MPLWRFSSTHFLGRHLGRGQSRQRRLQGLFRSDSISVHRRLLKKVSSAQLLG